MTLEQLICYKRIRWVRKHRDEYKELRIILA